MTRLFAGTPLDIPPRCEICDALVDECRCSDADKAAFAEAQRRAASRKSPSSQTANLRREKRKGGRMVTVVTGLAAEANDLRDLASVLQSSIGAGGTVKSDPDRIEIQGDHAAAVADVLKNVGYKVRLPN